jgi:hypothetical protein
MGTIYILVCDRCGKELKSDTLPDDWERVPLNPLDIQNMELCAECYQKFLEWFKEWSQNAE